MKTEAVYPYQARCFYQQGFRKLPHWALNVAGPFCLWPHRNRRFIHERMLNVVCSLSNYLKLPTNFTISLNIDAAISLRALITNEEKEWRFRRHYNEVTK